MVRVKVFSLVFVRTHRLASEEGRMGAGQKERGEREEKKRRGIERRMKVEEQKEEEKDRA